MENNIDKLFKDALNKKEMSVSDNIWKNVEANLPTHSAESSFKSKAFALAGLVATSLSVTLIILNYNSNINIEKITVTEKIEEVEVLDARNTEFENETRELPNQLASVEDTNLKKKNTNSEEEKSEGLVEEESETENTTGVESKKIGNAKKSTYLPFSFYKKEDKLYAKFTINNLKKNGALLVRLKTKSKTIATLKEKGYHKQARLVENEVLKDNKALYEAFKNNIDFCSVYFFYSDDSEKIEAEKFTGLLLNSNLKKDNSIKMKNPFFLIADIGAIQEENGQMTSNITRAIVLKDKEFDQLKNPFPYIQAASGEGRIAKHVHKLNKKLHSYYELVQK